ncbi:hypothetical protein BBJ28_00001357 [Nothophytophthora sp. Chile5]|nr:hypothetical protein BBJ28_00001357 [Nothophytophthora sp. Chile5]
MERPSWTLERLERAVEGFATQLQCAICLCAYENPVSLPCNHCFCEECIHRALELKAVCPICKAPAKKRRLRYDTMIQQLLRATEMLCAPPTAADQATAKVKIEKAVEKSPAKVKAAVGSDEIKASGSSGDASEKPPTKKKAKKTPAAAAVELRSTRSSPRRSAAYDLQTETPMSPALFEITAPRAAKTLAATAIAATSPQRRVRSPNGKQAAKSSDGGKHTPSPRKRPRRAATNAAEPAKTTAKGEASNGTRPPVTKAALNARSADPGMTAESQTQLPPEIERFQVGDLVEIVERMWAGINKPGGTARIKTVNADGTYNVKFVIGSGKEKSVPSVFIHRPAEEIVSDTTPSRAVKKRQRRHVSEAVTSPVISSAEMNRVGSSPHSTGKAKVKTKRSGMVFLCSGIKEARMEQIKEWAELLGADVVQHWSNHVTHLIVKCVSSDDDDDEVASVRDSDVPRTPLKHTTGKRELFSDPPSETQPRRWVVIRSLKYLKALVGGRWVVSDEWLEGENA